MNKKTKLLSIFLLAGVIGVGVAAGVTGCSKKHTHEWSETYVEVDGKHYKTCSGCDELLDEHDAAYDDQFDTTCNHEGCDVTRAVPYKVAADVTGLIIEGVDDTDVELSSSKTSHTIDKSAIHVYFDKSGTKGDEVPAANLVLVLKNGDGATVTSWENITNGDEYHIYASLTGAAMASGATTSIDDVTGTVTVVISNPVKANSLAVKDVSGLIITQAQSVTNEMTSTWTYEVTLANGEKMDVPADEVTIGGLSTVKITDSGIATLTWGEITGQQAYTITANPEKVAQSFALNFGTLTAAQKTALKTGDVSVQNGRFVIQATSGEVADHRGSAPEYDGKYLAYRLKMGGKYNGDNAKRYIKITTDGEALITVYGYANTGTAGTGDANRYLALYKNVTYGPKEEGSDKEVATASDIVGERQNTKQKENSKHEFVVSEAGTYWLVCEEGDVCITYVQVDQLVAQDAGVEEISLDSTGSELIKLSVNTQTQDYKQAFTVGDTFTVNSEYTVNGIYYNPVTMERKPDSDLTSTVTYWLGETQLTPDTTQLTASLFTTLGEQTITVKSGSETATYKIVVESAVSGVTGITAQIAATVNPELSGSSDKLTLNKSDISAAIVGENANATVQITSVKYAAKGSEEKTEISDSVELAVGEYVIYVAATVTDTNASTTAQFETTIALTVHVTPTEGELTNVTWTVDSAAQSACTGESNANLDSNNKMVAAVKINDNITVGKTNKVGSSSTTVNGTSYSSYIQLSGAKASTIDSEKYIAVTVEAACTIKVICKGNTGRNLECYSKSGDTFTMVGSAVESISDSNGVEATYTISAAGTYYLVSSSSSINIYQIQIIYS